MGCDSQFDEPVPLPAAKPKRKIQMYRYEATPDGATPKVEAEVEAKLLHDIGEIMKTYARHQQEYDLRMEQQHSVSQQLRDLEDDYNIAKHKLLQEQAEAVDKARLYADLLRNDSLNMVLLWKKVYGKEK